MGFFLPNFMYIEFSKNFMYIETRYSLAVHFLLLLAPLSSLLFAISSAQLPTDQGTKSSDVLFWNIDCGSSTSLYTDNNSIVWIGDNLFMKNGETRVVALPQGLDLSISAFVMSTLRVFTTAKMNCYPMRGNIGSGRVLVRASFFYGNYDSRSTPPTFDMYFNGNYWATVKTSLDELDIYEGVFSVKGNTISVCLAQTHDHFPFISALEVRSLDTGMYRRIDSDYPLYFRLRYAFGANRIIRSPKDVFDRLWARYGLEGFTNVKSDSLSLTVNGLEDKPPKSVIETGMIPSGPTRSLNLLLGDLTNHNAQIYIKAYFSEVYRLNSTEKRSFWIYINDKLWEGGPVIPPYGSALEILIPNVTPLANTTFSLVQTPDSTLPPLINAMEVFSVGEKMIEGTTLRNGASAIMSTRCLLKTMLIIIASLLLLAGFYG